MVSMWLKANLLGDWSKISVLGCMSLVLVLIIIITITIIIIIIIILIIIILFNEKSSLQILQALLQANQSVRIHVVVICISPYHTVNLFESVNIVNITCKPINIMYALHGASSKYADSYLVYTYVLFMYMPSQTARQLNTHARANQNAQVQFVQTKYAWALFMQAMMHTAAK